MLNQTPFELVQTREKNLMVQCCQSTYKASEGSMLTLSYIADS